MKTNDELAQELEAEKTAIEKEKHTPKKPSGMQVKGAALAWMLGAFSIDAATAWLVYIVSGYWPYGVAWLLAGAGGLALNEWFREHPLNNDDQKRIAELGLTVSWVGVILMGLFTGIAYVLQASGAAWVEIVVIAAVVGLFFFHVYQSYQYHLKDDEYLARREEARLEAKSASEIAAIHRAARRVDAKKTAEATADGYRKDHGAAFDAARGRPTVGNQNSTVRNAPNVQMRTAGAYNSETEQVNSSNSGESAPKV